MSVLDRAFIRAFNKGTDADGANVTEVPQEEAHRADETNEVPSASTAEQLIDTMCGGQVYRIDPGHSGRMDQCPQSHVQLVPAGTGADLSFAIPYHEICPPAFPDLAPAEEAEQPSVGSPSEVDAEPKVASEQREQVTEEVPTDRDEPSPETHASRKSDSSELAPADEPTPTQPATDAAKSLRNAASLKMPATLPLPEVFQLPEDELGKQQQVEDPATFSPDWEVDRFVWPPICTELLEAQSRYFQHVGAKLMAATEESDHVIMISGSRRGEGRSTLAMCLARCAADAGINVALVDADLHNAQLGTRLGMETPRSWLEVVAAHGSLQEAAVTSIEDDLTLFPLTGTESVDMRPGDGRLIMFVRRVSAHYPLVIIDTGPLGRDEGHLFESDAACPIDTAIVVRDLRNTEERGALATAERLQLGGIQAVGIAENFHAAE